MAAAGARGFFGGRRWGIVPGLALVIVGVLLATRRGPMPVNDPLATFPGLGQLAAEGPPVRMLFIHGMQQHTAGWAERSYLQYVAGVLHWSIRDGEHAGVKVDGDDAAHGYQAGLQVYNVYDEQGRRKLVAYELTWSPLTAPFKQERFTRDMQQWRPTVNAQIRGVLDDGMSDAVLYLTNYNNNILGRTVSRALEMFYNGELDGAPADPASPVAFLSESLGVKMLFDALEDQKNRQGKPEERERFQNMIGNTREVFMAANQLALLDVPNSTADWSPAPEDKRHERYRTLGKLLDVMEPAVAPGGTQPTRAHVLYLVAFSDPYDVLSYDLEKSDLGEHPQVQLVNFSPRNAPDYLWLVTPVQEAHTTYGVNPQVVKVLAEGYGWTGK